MYCKGRIPSTPRLILHNKTYRRKSRHPRDSLTRTKYNVSRPSHADTYPFHLPSLSHFRQRPARSPALIYTIPGPATALFLVIFSHFHSIAMKTVKTDTQLLSFSCSTHSPITNTHSNLSYSTSPSLFHPVRLNATHFPSAFSPNRSV
jgi:hypothetical protein